MLLDDVFVRFISLRPPLLRYISPLSILPPAHTRAAIDVHLPEHDALHRLPPRSFMPPVVLITPSSSFHFRHCFSYFLRLHFFVYLARLISFSRFSSISSMVGEGHIATATFSYYFIISRFLIFADEYFHGFHFFFFHRSFSFSI